MAAQAAAKAPTKTDQTVPYYEPDPKEVALSLRLPEELRDDLKLIARVWSRLDEEIGAGKKVSINEVIVRLLKVGRDGVWAEAGGRPKDELAETRLVKRLAEAYVKPSTEK